MPKKAENRENFKREYAGFMSPTL